MKHGWHAARVAMERTSMGSAGNSEQGKIVVGECINECILRMNGYAGDLPPDKQR
jgi:hypothetical protein